jgi:glycosyltransferase involved in cell wall biosynthesis
MPKVSVIVPNDNHARFLRQRIGSVLRQTFLDFELILLVDCSTDDSRSILAQYAQDPRVKLKFKKKIPAVPSNNGEVSLWLAANMYGSPNPTTMRTSDC